MSEPTSVFPKRLVWMGDSLDKLRRCPKEIREVFGFVLYQAQMGGKHVLAKPLKGFGAGVLEVVADWRNATFRAVYTVKLLGRVYVLHVFQKKSKRGIATPRRDLELLEQRLKRAIELQETMEN